MAKIVWTEPALDDLRQIIDFIAQDSPIACCIVALVHASRNILLHMNPNEWSTR